MITRSKLGEIKDVIQDCNLNFLIGSGLSSPYLKILGEVEKLLTEIEAADIPADQQSIVKCSVYKHYFDGVMALNLDVVTSSEGCMPTLANYEGFLRALNKVLQRRKSSLMGKEVNLFTTNIDVFLEKAIEEVGLECNDGFNGRFKPSFSLSNFHKTRFKRSLHFDNVSELPVFNLLKLHGSLTWELQEEDLIAFSPDLAQVAKVRSISFPEGALVPIVEGTTSAALQIASHGKGVHESVEPFISAYEALLIVNPTKEKFRHTILNYTYYELLRIFSNELEKDNTVLFVMGFSFADEHIREIVLRAANSNPTLLVYVIAHSPQSAKEISARFGSTSVKNANLSILEPPSSDEGETKRYDLATINEELFGNLFRGDSQSSSANGENIES